MNELATEAAKNARLHAQRKYVMSLEKIIKDSENQLAQQRAQMAARGLVLSGAMWKITADTYIARIEALLRVRLTTLLDAYELFQVPLDNEIEKDVLKEVTDLRESQVLNLGNVVYSQPWLGEQGATYVAGAVQQISNPMNAVKVEIEERRQRAKARVQNTTTSPPSTEALIFVSCGQSTPTERRLGQSIANLVEAEAGCKAYFAENQTTLEGVTENILKRLNDAVGFIAIMHPRGNVSNPSNPDEAEWVRGSVWVEQEVAIAAFISQALQRPMRVRAYVHESVRREGLRDKLHLNPVLFKDDAEIIEDLKTLLPSWRALSPREAKQPLSLQPLIGYQRVPVPGGGEDERYMLIAGVENDGDQEVAAFRLDVEFPEFFLDEGGHVLKTYSGKPGIALFRLNSRDRKIDSFYPTDKIPNLITFHYAIRGKTKRENPELLEEKVTATVFSGNMRPNRHK